MARSPATCPAQAAEPLRWAGRDPIWAILAAPDLPAMALAAAAVPMHPRAILALQVRPGRRVLPAAPRHRLRRQCYRKWPRRQQGEHSRCGWSEPRRRSLRPGERRAARSRPVRWRTVKRRPAKRRSGGRQSSGIIRNHSARHHCSRQRRWRRFGSQRVAGYDIRQPNVRLAVATNWWSARRLCGREPAIRTARPAAAGRQLRQRCQWGSGRRAGSRTRLGFARRQSPRHGHHTADPCRRAARSPGADSRARCRSRSPAPAHLRHDDR